MAEEQPHPPYGRARGRAGPGRGRGVMIAALAARQPGAARGVAIDEYYDPALARGRALNRPPPIRDPKPGPFEAAVDTDDDFLSSSSGSVISSMSSGTRNFKNSVKIRDEAEDVLSPLPGMGRGATRGIRDWTECSLFRTRPDHILSKKGNDGSGINVSTNYFSLIKKTNWKLLQYRVDYSPPLENTRVKKALLYRHKDKLPKFMFDGSLLFATSPLTGDNSELVLTSHMDKEKCDVNMTIRLVGEIQPSDGHYIQFFNIVLRSAMEKLQLELIKRDYYDPKSAVHFNQYKIELWPGYVTSIRQHEEKILLCCEIGNKILRTDTVLDQMSEIIKRSPNSSHRSTVEKALLGCIIITRYNNRTYRIDEIAWDKHPTDEFEGRNGEKISYVKYYSQRYNKTIRDLKQPMLISMPKVREERSGQSGPIYLIPELCFMTGLSEEQRSNFQLMKALGDYTRQDPKTRTATLKKFSDRISSQADIKAELDAWNLEFNHELETLKARVLSPEDILGAGTTKATYKIENADWGSCFRKWNMTSSKNLTKWALLHSVKDENLAKDFVTSLLKVAPSLGMSMSKPKMVSLPDNKTPTYLAQLDKILDMNPQMVMVVVPNNKGDHYSTIKKKCYIERPVPCQIVTATVLSKPKGLMSVATKVAIQINCKLGGEPWAVKMPLKDTMVIGYDTYHDTLHKGRSVGAIVASMNNSLTKYMSIANIHTNPSQELHDNMCPAISRALRKYHELNGHLPSRIIVYRDGVGDGQIPYVVEHEIKAIIQSLAKAGLPEEQLKFTYIIVNKKINTKIMQVNSLTQTAHASNAPSGTIVDDVITLPERYDFYLISQSVRQGTVNPTSYNVIRDTSGLQPDHLQKLTYKLAHLYYNWPGTVRVPAPCQYAHKLAFLVGESLHQVPNEEMEDTLFYL